MKESKLNALFIVSSPLQVINALEAINKYPINNSKIFVLDGFLNKDRKNLGQIEFTTKTFMHDNVKYFFDEKHNLYTELIKLFFCVCLCRFKFDYVFIGNYTARLHRIIGSLFKKRKTVLLDDGVGTIKIQNEFKKDNHYNLFTIFNVTPFAKQIITKNNFEFLKGIISKTTIEYEDSVYFIGGKLPEVNIMTYEYYYTILLKAKGYFCKLEFIYIAHRGESKEKLDYIRNNLNIEVRELSFPIELLYLENILPKQLVSISSTALISLKTIYNQITVYSIKIDFNELIERKEHSINISNLLKKHTHLIE